MQAPPGTDAAPRRCCATCGVTRGRHGGTLMRKTLLATVAAAALAAGTIAVSAQGMQGGTGGAGGPGGAGAGGAPSIAPAEKMDKGGPKGGAKGGAGERSTTGQGTQTERGGGQMDRGTSSQPSGGERGQTSPSQMNRDSAQPKSGQSETQKHDQKGAQQKGQSGTQQGQTTGQTGTQTGQGQSGSTSASLSTEQRTKVRETVLKGGNVNRVSNVNFNVSVGTVVPRSVHLVTVPSTIVEIHPAWRGYQYFVVNDEIIIVEPGTLRIVAVIS